MNEVILKQKINGNDLIGWFSYGAEEVGLHKKHLNEINVFPIADGDTGTNLVTTLTAMVELAHRKDAFGGMMTEISEAGMAHARGNSGIIFASYINGLAMESSTYDEIGKKEFSQAAFKAVDYLYEAIENPVKGTMITVISDWAEFLFVNHEKYLGFDDFLAAAYKIARESLEKTTQQMEILRKHNLVDAGAQGFVNFLKGINRFFLKEQVAGSSDPVIKQPVYFDDQEPGEKQFCSEFLIKLKPAALDSATTVTDLKNDLTALGVSIIVFSQANKMKIHVHTDQPDAVVQRLLQDGTIIQQKIEDMRFQRNIKINQRARIAIVTDSIADLPESFKLEHQIHTLSLGLMFGENPYFDKQTIKLNQLDALINDATGYPTSSQPEPRRVANLLEELAENYDSILFITVSDQLSGTFKTVSREAKKLEELGKKITVIDSRLNSGAQGLLVKRAAELVARNKSHDEIVTALKETIPKTKIYVCLDTLDYAVRGGRVSNTVGRVGKMVGLRPIMTLDEKGAGATFSAALSKEGITRKILKLVRETMATKGIDGYSIVHAENLELALEYQKKLVKIVGKEPEFIAEISSIIAINSGIGTVAVCIRSN